MTVSYGPAYPTVAHQDDEKERRPSDNAARRESHAHRKSTPGSAGSVEASQFNLSSRWRQIQSLELFNLNLFNQFLCSNVIHSPIVIFFFSFHCCHPPKSSLSTCLYKLVRQCQKSTVAPQCRRKERREAERKGGGEGRKEEATISSLTPTPPATNHITPSTPSSPGIRLHPKEPIQHQRS